MKLKIGCRQAAKLMIAQMATKALRFTAAKAMRINARKTHPNANKHKYSTKASHSKAAARVYIMQTALFLERRKIASANINLVFGGPCGFIISKD